MGTPQHKGLVDFQKLDFEFYQGAHVYLTQELVRTDFTDSSTVSQTYGIGAQFFPRPHYDFQVAWQKAKSDKEHFADYGLFSFLLYL